MAQSDTTETTLVPNEIYDLITALSSKLESIVAYQKFAKNGSANDQIGDFQLPADRLQTANFWRRNRVGLARFAANDGQATSQPVMPPQMR